MINSITKSLKKHVTGVIFFLAITAVVWGCKEKFAPNIIEQTTSQLVVEGLINTGNDSTIITLSRTYKLGGNVNPPPEKAAIVFVENNAGQVYRLTEIKDGVYAIPPSNLDQTKKYRLRILTKANKEYLSDFVESKTSSPIDNLNFNFNNNSLNIYANSVDPSGNSRYYQYTYVETYQYRAAFRPAYKVVNHQLLPREATDIDKFDCWRNLNSPVITLFSTKGLSEDRVSQKSIISIPSDSEKILIQYSILVTQNVLTQQGFNFWSALRKNTEQVGGIFDSQPSQLYGNIHATANPSELVIGFISAGTITQKRINIKRIDLPESWRPYRFTCTPDTLSLNDLKKSALDPPVPIYYPISEAYNSLGQFRGYLATTGLECVDCRVRGGSLIKPSYW